MSLPMVQKTTQLHVKEAMFQNPDFARELLIRLQKENPRVALLMVKIGRLHDERIRFLILNTVMGMYRMLEIQKEIDAQSKNLDIARLPFLKEGIFNSVSHSLRSNRQLYKEVMERLGEENEHIATFIMDNVEEHDYCSEPMIVAVAVYLALESQQEVDEMEQE